MCDNNNNDTSRIDICIWSSIAVISILLVALKFFGVIGFSWWWVTAPIWISILVFIGTTIYILTNIFKIDESDDNDTAND